MACVLTRVLVGQGQGPGAFAAVVEELGRQCGSTSMIFVMRVAAAKVIETSTQFPYRDEMLRYICAGQHLTTFAISERGSRSQFWAPVSKLEMLDAQYQTQAFKSWVTAAHHADSYVASAQSPGGARGPIESTLYLIPRTRHGGRFADTFDGLGLRGNDSSPVAFEQVKIAPDDFLTEHGKGMECLLQVALPWFTIGTSAMAHGLCRAAIDATSRHLQTTGFEHTGTGLRDLPNLRARLAEMSVATEQSRALLGHAIREMSAPDEATPLWVLRARMSALQTALHVTDLAMKTCGGAAFSRHLSIERMFRDARAGWVRAPTVDHLADFLGCALTGLPLF